LAGPQTGYPFFLDWAAIWKSPFFSWAANWKSNFRPTFYGPQTAYSRVNKTKKMNLKKGVKTTEKHFYYRLARGLTKRRVYGVYARYSVEKKFRVSFIIFVVVIIVA
jgi:hypothetical protein